MNQVRIIQGYPVPGNWRQPLDEEDGGKPTK